MDGDSSGNAEAQAGRAAVPDGGADVAGDADVTFELIGGTDGGPGLDLDHERFAYAGKFVTSRTGKAVLREPERGESGGAGELLAAAAFDRDRTDRSVAVVRYVTVRRDRRGEGHGALLLASLAGRLLGPRRVGDAGNQSVRADDAPTGDARAFDDVRRVTIAVNNPFAYEAAFKAGFGFTGERTGLAELRCARPGDRSPAAYRRGLAAFLERDDLGDAARAFVDERRDGGPPPTVAPLPRP